MNNRKKTIMESGSQVQWRSGSQGRHCREGFPVSKDWTMNIFILDRNIEKCARYHADQHVVKMILEGAQILCTVLNETGATTPYRSTHVNHPCVLWAGESRSNWAWLRKLTLFLNEEYQYRYGTSRDHRSAALARNLPLPSIPDRGLTEFFQAMPGRYRIAGNPVQAYRNYYVGEKSRFARWTRRRAPRWYREALEIAGKAEPVTDDGSVKKGRVSRL